MALGMIRGKTARVCLLLFVALSVGGSVSAPALEATASTTAVTWSVDHAAKTITVTANIVFFVTPPPQNPFQQQQFQANVERIKRAIESAWNGHQFKCYALIVKVNARTANGQRDVHDNEVPVRFDAGVYPADTTGKVKRSRSNVSTTGPDDYLSDSPQFVPKTGSQSIASEWSFAAADGA